MLSNSSFCFHDPGVIVNAAALNILAAASQATVAHHENARRQSKFLKGKMNRGDRMDTDAICRLIDET